eukprot:CAMPEP_0171015772 /NCGR_PEP_ID=MMETSP0736-20130129/26197_1 /TAXON_ID=186038 /ORGANISM="Fragilariopsis kerguelensis, Strain L26-C5" /LENGTH=73 /DNA_ID=CAMNT_0011450803 /DNA_START=38 /DNA_END=256 /DNA_ORIENTATION=+
MKELEKTDRRNKKNGHQNQEVDFVHPQQSRPQKSDDDVGVSTAVSAAVSAVAEARVVHARGARSRTRTRRTPS